MLKQLTLGYVPCGTGTVKPFDTIFPSIMHVSPDHIREHKVDALVIWGGSDISPTIYNKPVEKYTGATEVLSHRDKIEVGVCKAAIEAGIPILGICRGAQLLCALAGGSLYQHVEGHAHGQHEITTSKGVKYQTSSVHHQMMDIRDLKPDDYEMIAWASSHLSEAADGVIGEEPEIVWFPKIKGLAIQGHPEFMHPDCDFVDYTRRLVKEYML